MAGDSRAGTGYRCANVASRRRTSRRDALCASSTTWPTASGPGAPASSPAPATTSPGSTGRRAGCPRLTPSSPSAAGGRARGAFRAELDRIRPPAGDGPRPGRPPPAALRDRPGQLGVRHPAGPLGPAVTGPTRRIGPVFDALLRPGVDQARIAEVIRLLRAVPGTLAHAPDALAGAAREFAGLALAELDDVGRPARCLRRRARPRSAPAAGAELWSAVRDAAGALADYARWLAAALPGLPPAVPVGPRALPVVPARGRLRAARHRRDRRHRPPRVRPRGLARAGPPQPGQGGARAAAAGQRGRPVPRRGRRRAGGPPVLRASRACSASPARCAATWPSRCPPTWSRCASSAWPTS